MAVRSTRLFGPTPLSITDGTSFLLYEVPSGRTAIFRTVFIMRPAAGTAARILVQVRPVEVGTNRALAAYLLGTGDGDFVKETGPLILQPGDQLRCGKLSVDSINILVTGFGTLLLGAPQ